MRQKPQIPAEVEEYRDEHWCREGTRQIETAGAAERFIEQIGFAACLADARRPGPVFLELDNDPHFLVYGDSTLPDPDGYSVFGTVTSGLDIVDKIAAAGVAPGGASATDGFPAAPIIILRTAATEKKA